MLRLNFSMPVLIVIAAFLIGFIVIFGWFVKVIVALSPAFFLIIVVYVLFKYLNTLKK